MEKWENFLRPTQISSKKSEESRGKEKLLCNAVLKKKVKKEKFRAIIKREKKEEKRSTQNWELRKKKIPVNDIKAISE